MSIKDDFNEFTKAGQEGSDNIMKDIPDAWRPRSEIGNDGGFIVSTPRPDGNTPGAEEIIREANLNPEEWAVTSHRRSRWQRYDGEWLESFKISVVPVKSSIANDFDAEKLIESMMNWRPESSTDFEGDLTAVYSLGDTQYGNWGPGAEQDTFPPLPLDKKSSVSITTSDKNVTISAGGRTSTYKQPSTRQAGNDFTLWGSDPFFPSADAMVENVQLKVNGSIVYTSPTPVPYPPPPPPRERISGVGWNY
jgi:hypothetical protein